VAYLLFNPGAFHAVAVFLRSLLQIMRFYMCCCHALHPQVGATRIWRNSTMAGVMYH
jgi:hypothetical protein